MSLQKGHLVSDFTLTGSNGETLSLSSLEGSTIVIYFYPKDNTPGCTAESCSFRDFHSEFHSLNTVVIGISPDDLKSHKKFVDKFSLPFTLLCDTEQTVSQMFGVWKEKNMYGKTYMGVERSTFVISSERKLLQEWRKVKVEGHVEEVLAYIKSI